MDTLALSPQQRHIRDWGRTGVTHDGHCDVRVDGPLDAETLHAALAGVVRNHPLLHSDDPVEAAPGNLEAGAEYGLLRATLAGAGSGGRVLSLSLPASCVDARSLDNLVEQIARAYRAGGAAEVPDLQYADFADWQNSLALDDDAGAGRRWPRLRDVVRAQRLPFEDGPAAGGPERSTRPVEVPAGLAGLLRKAAADGGASEDDFLLACWTLVLWQQSRASEVAVGVVTDGRVYEELEPVIGPCAKALPVLVRLTGTDRFADVLAGVVRGRAEASDGLEYFQWPQADPADSAHPRWGFESHAAATPVAAGSGVTFTRTGQSVWSGPFTAKLVVDRFAGQPSLTLAHGGGGLDPEFAGCLLDQLLTLTAAAAAAPDTPIADLPSVSPDRALRWSARVNPAPTDFGPFRTAHQMVQERASETPDRLAVTAQDGSLTYGELDARANRLARHLRALGVRPEAPVGIRLERGLDMIVAMLAAHKAGGAYVPLDPGYPADHIAAILRTTPVAVVIAGGPGPADEPAGDLPTVRLDTDREAIAARSAERLDLDTDPRSLAYVLHTSGSTGIPKGVQVSHEAFANFLRSMAREPGLARHDSLVAVTTLSFDIAGLELWLPLTVGARVTVASRDQAADPLALARVLDQASATVLQATPVTWRMLLADGWPGSDGLTALVGGEALPPELAAALRPRVRRLWNMYGPTETTIWSTCSAVEPDHGSGVDVGAPIANTCAHIVDDRLRPVAVGMVGELCIGGLGLARGYVGRPALTAERFVADPFDGRPGARMYRTGDLARYDARGRIHVLGRSDSQVKIRGFRIELGAVEAALARHPGVRAAVATVVREPSGELRLDAHVVLGADADVRVEDLRAHLGARLPAAMVPSRIGVLSVLPLTANGKVDRAALPEVAPVSPSAGPHLQASTELERVIARVWGAVLGIAEPGTTQTFFELGGHSVLLAEAALRLRDELGRVITPLDLLEHPTIAALARHLTAHGAAAPDGAAAPSGGTREAARAAGRGRLARRRSKMEGEEQ